MSGLEQPKKPAGGGFGRFVAEKRSEFQAKCAGQPITAVTKMAGQAWKALSEAAQQPYKVKFVAAQKKYEVDMAAFLAAGGEKQKGAAALRTEKRKAKEGNLKKQKDPDAPKRPAGGAYGCFMAANRAEFTKLCPGSMTGVAKLAGEKWKAASAAEKEKYEKEYKVKADAYQEAMKSYVPPAVEEEDDQDVKETPAKKPKISQEEKSADKKEQKDQKKSAAQEQKEQKKAAAQEKKDGKSAKAKGKAKADVPTMLAEIPPTVLAKADKSGMTEVLKKLLCRDDIKGANISASQAMSALEGAEGLLHPARRALLGA